MVNIRYDKISKQCRIEFSGDNFSSLLKLVKDNYLKYEPNTHSWLASSLKVYNLLDKIGDIEDYSLPIEDKKIIEEKRFEHSPLETEFQRFKFNNSLLKFSPILGKPPFENFQIESIKKGICQNRLGLFLGMGSGKTYI